MLVSVQFRSRFGDHAWGGQTYTYRCDYDAKVGDLVDVPAGNASKVARIAEIDVPEYSVDPDIFPRLKAVIGPAKYEDTLFAETDAAAADTPDLPEIAIADNIIVVKQLPIIENQLRELRGTVEKKVNEALSLAVTEDTVKAVKVVKAALNKEYKELEDRRKKVKEVIFDPYYQFEATYKEIIGNLYTEADRQLKEKIDAVENSIKEEKRAALKEYFDEYRASLNLNEEPIASFENWNTKVNKTASDKSLRVAAKAYLDGVYEDLNTINGMEDADEILVEYRACRSLSRAIATVGERHRLAEESRRRRAEMAAEKAAREAVEREAAARVEAAAAKIEPSAPPVAVPTQESAEGQSAAQEKIFPRFTFTVINATRSQLIKVREFMKQEGIQYE